MREIIKDRIEKIEENIAPEGYKKTKIGIIPEDWQVKKLKECVSKFIVPMRDKPKVFKGNIPWCRIEDIQGKYLETSLSNKFVDEDIVENMNLKIIPKNSLICSCSATLGICAITKNDLLTNQTFIGLVPNNKLNLNYFYYNMIENKNKLDKLSSGTTIAYLSRKEFENFNIVLPPMEEQEKIADILTLWDEYIENMDNLIEKKEELKKGLMQKLLTGEKRLPGYAQPWKKVKLGDVAEIVMGQSPKSINYNTNNVGLPLIQGNADMKNGYTLPKIYTNEITKTCEIGDILMSVRAPVGTLAISKHKACIGRGICRIKGNKFIYYKLLNNQKEFNKYSQGSTFEAINFSTLKNIRINLPPLDEQRAIADILSKADEEIELLKELRDKKLEEKKGLMQLLLTGIIRV